MGQLTGKLVKSIVFIFLVFIVKLSFSQSTTWPIDTDNHVICGSYGTNELGMYHNGVDIYEVQGTAVISLIDCTIRTSVAQNHSINVYLQINPNVGNVFYQYAHCEEMPEGENHINLYDGEYPDITAVEDIPISAGQQFAVISDKGLASVSFPHVHFEHTTIVSNVLSTLNPLDLDIISPEDPEEENPKFGPLFIKRINSAQSFEYQDYNACTFLFNKIQVVREIIDDMGWVPDDVAYYAEEDFDAWPLENQLGNQIPTMREHGIYSSPYSVLFEVLKGYDNTIVYDEEKIFTGNYNDDIMQFIYEPKSANNTPDYTYCYKMTSLSYASPPGSPPEKYWNTRLAKDQNWDGDYAPCPDVEVAKYPDGMYKLHMVAKDKANHKDEEWLEVIVDNFKPFIKKVEIYANNLSDLQYSREWIWNSSSEQYDLEPIPLGVAITENDNSKKKIDV